LALWKVKTINRRITFGRYNSLVSDLKNHSKLQGRL
jgi:hypothetical protein